MNLIIRILIGLAVITAGLVALSLLARLAGLLIWLAIAAVIGAAILGMFRGKLIRSSIVEKPTRREEHRLDRQTDQALEELENRLT